MGIKPIAIAFLLESIFYSSCICQTLLTTHDAGGTISTTDELSSASASGQPRLTQVTVVRNLTDTSTTNTDPKLDHPSSPLRSPPSNSLKDSTPSSLSIEPNSSLATLSSGSRVTSDTHSTTPHLSITDSSTYQPTTLSSVSRVTSDTHSTTPHLSITDSSTYQPTTSLIYSSSNDTTSTYSAFTSNQTITKVMANFAAGLSSTYVTSQNSQYNSSKRKALTWSDHSSTASTAQNNTKLTTTSHSTVATSSRHSDNATATTNAVTSRITTTTMVTTTITPHMSTAGTIKPIVFVNLIFAFLVLLNSFDQL